MPAVLDLQDDAYAMLADALQPLLPEHNARARRAVAVAWLSSVLDQLRTTPAASLTSAQPIDIAGHWRSACASGATADELPLVRSGEIAALADSLVPWFEAAGAADLDIYARESCVLAWLSELLDQIRADPVALVRGAGHLVPGDVLRTLVVAWSANTRLHLQRGS